MRIQKSHTNKSTTYKNSFSFFPEKLTFVKKKNNSPSKFFKKICRVRQNFALCVFCT